MKVFIDTEIWVFAKKNPDPDKFAKTSEYNTAKEFHIRSKNFLKQQVNQNEILMTCHQLSEIYHVLGFRGLKLPLEAVKKYCNQLIKSDFIKWYSISLKHFNEALKLSMKSRIHIWDFLCVVPLYSEAEILFSCDAHFKHSYFQALGPKIENPLKEWLKL